MDHPALSINTSGFWSSSEGTDVCLSVIWWTATQHVRANNSRWSPAGSTIEGDSMAVPALCATRAGIIVMSVLALAITACTSSAAEDSGDQPSQVGNVIFLHPDGTGLNSWNVARAYWKGPDGALAWDELPEMAAYRGHMEDVATGTSNGGATTHAFGYKVDSPGSFGKDGDGEAQPPTDRFINSLSGYQGSIMREAANNGHPVGVVNDGMIAEPGTGAFLAEVSSRDDTTGISQQILLGRPNSTDTAPHVILGGGEADFVPENTPRCAPDATTLDCRVHEVAEGDGSTTTGRRTDGQNLLRIAEQQGYIVMRTRAEFEQLRDRVAAEADFAPKVLGLFAAVDTFNDVPEEVLIANGFVDPAIPAEDRRSNLILFGDRPGTPGYNPPTVAEMSELATTILGASRPGRPSRSSS
jgi:alkaline phosphatase